MPLAQRIVARIRAVRAKTSAGCYVLADAGGRVYVLSEEGSSTACALAEYGGWLVGRYAASGSALPVVLDVYDDLVQHWTDIGFLTSELVIRCPPPESD